MHVVIDTKNLALYTRGISAFVRPLIGAWLSHRPDFRFSFVGPMFNMEAFAGFKNWAHHVIAWPYWLPRKLRHPLYDNVLFPRVVSRLNPEFLFSPYHDVLLPSRRNTRSVMTVHDTCIDELDREYPAAFRAYYVAMLRRNLRRASHILTVSESSRARVVERYRLDPCKVSVIYNAIEPEFAAVRVDNHMVSSLRKPYGGARLIFYPGGCEFRKNLGRLMDAFSLLTASGENYYLLVTGDSDFRWDRELARYDNDLRERIHFLGYLTLPELKAHYAAADAVVYPSLCEGFGRVCLEAMAVGTPIACSDLEVFREVVGDYAFYFDPTDPRRIVSALQLAIASGRITPRHDPRFSLETVLSRFTVLMDRLVVAEQINA